MYQITEEHALPECPEDFVYAELSGGADQVVSEFLAFADRTDGEERTLYAYKFSYWVLGQWDTLATMGLISIKKTYYVFTKRFKYEIKLGKADTVIYFTDPPSENLNAITQEITKKMIDKINQSGHLISAYDQNETSGSFSNE